MKVKNLVWGYSSKICTSRASFQNQILQMMIQKLKNENINHLVSQKESNVYFILPQLVEWKQHILQVIKGLQEYIITRLQIFTYLRTKKLLICCKLPKCSNELWHDWTCNKWHKDSRLKKNKQFLWLWYSKP